MVLQKGYTPHLALHPPAMGYPGISQLEPLCEPTLDITIAIPVTFFKKKTRSLGFSGRTTVPL